MSLVTGTAMPIRPHVLRTIAHAELEKIFPGQARDVREELVTSLVRQWTTYEGRAGLFTVPVHYWLSVVEVEGSVHAGTEVLPGTLKQHLGSWGILDRDLPHVVHELSVAQSATFINGEGLTVRVQADPRDHTFRFEEVSDEEEDEA